MNHQQLNTYLESKKNSWAPSTLRVQAALLNSLLPALTGRPEDLWDHLSSLKPYSRVHAWTSVVAYTDTLFEANPYRAFRSANRRLFKNAYEKKQVSMTYEQAIEKINAIPDESIRAHAMFLLRNGLRYTESLTEKNGSVTGKGDKKRKVFLPFSGAERYTKSYRWFAKCLKSVGLRPHDLRKLAATRFVEKGMKEADLMKVFGWASIQTASIYLQPKKDEELKRIMERAHE